MALLRFHDCKRCDAGPPGCAPSPQLLVKENKVSEFFKMTVNRQKYVQTHVPVHKGSVADPDPWNLYHFPGSGSVSIIGWIRNTAI